LLVHSHQVRSRAIRDELAEHHERESAWEVVKRWHDHPERTAPQADYAYAFSAQDAGLKLVQLGTAAGPMLQLATRAWAGDDGITRGVLHGPKELVDAVVELMPADPSSSILPGGKWLDTAVGVEAAQRVSDRTDKVLDFFHAQDDAVFDEKVQGE
jgi:hypothetical protein